ncbi:uncharacterized protein LOC134290963 [Aedes albopictus]|uniref:DUF5641 domain-containing protein n=1 Tax=Aedes albopictus TaxID=7160 RepID=A0ABM1ZCV3_AEDAL
MSSTPLIELFTIHVAQRESFPDEYSNLSAGVLVSKSSPLKWLKAYVDEFGLIRAGGRLSNAVLPENAKHPIVLSVKHPLARLVTVQCHRTLLHAGRQLMVASLRRRFWVLGGRNLTRSVYHLLSNFSNVPILRLRRRLLGTAFIKSPVRKRGPTKVYVAIFICFCTRAVHIELVSDLMSAASLAALRRLVARRGKISELHSDNATTFKGASHALHRVYSMLKVDETDRNQILSWCADNEIPTVKSANTHLLKKIGNSSLSYEDMLTLLSQVEMGLNSRPVTPLSSEPSDLEALKPGHFLVGSNLQAVPEKTLTDIPENQLDHFELTKRHLQRIWARWYLEYLQQLQSRAVQGCKLSTAIKPGQLVVVKEDCLPLAQWPLVRISRRHRQSGHVEDCFFGQRHATRRTDCPAAHQNRYKSHPLEIISRAVLNWLDAHIS